MTVTEAPEGCAGGGIVDRGPAQPWTAQRFDRSDFERARLILIATPFF